MNARLTWMIEWHRTRTLRRGKRRATYIGLPLLVDEVRYARARWPKFRHVRRKYIRDVLHWRTLRRC